MANRVSSYSMLAVSASVDGLAVRGLFDGDDAITVEHGADIGAGLVGADGSAMFSQSADNSARITIRVFHSSPTHRQLTQKMLQQKAGQLIPFPFSVIDKGSGEGGSADQCFVMQAPADSKGKNATVRAWVLWTGDYQVALPNQAS